MFTGIIEKLGVLRAIERKGGSLRLRVAASGWRLKQGESVAVDGVCLTAIETRGGAFSADLSAETIARTNLGRVRPGGLLNLERSLRPSDRLGGHFVLGHVDARGAIEQLTRSRAGGWLVVRYPLRYHSLVAEKGSIAINGVSLTIAAVVPGRLEVALIPHTLAVTGFRDAVAGGAVNLEFDYLAKLVHRMLERAPAVRRRRP